MPEMGATRMPVILDPDRYDVLRTMTKSVQHPWNSPRFRIACFRSGDVMLLAIAWHSTGERLPKARLLLVTQRARLKKSLSHLFPSPPTHTRRFLLRNR